MAGEYRHITVRRDDGTRTSATVPGYLWQAFVRLHQGNEVAAIDTAKRWFEKDSYRLAERIFQAVMQAARQGELKIDPPESGA